MSETSLLQLQFGVCVRSLCVRALCVRSSGFVRDMTFTFVHGIEKNDTVVVLVE